MTRKMLPEPKVDRIWEMDEEERRRAIVRRAAQAARRQRLANAMHGQRDRP